MCKKKDDDIIGISAKRKSKNKNSMETKKGE
jgi:hypothetical protein